MAVVEPDPDEGRVRVARLTEAGREEWRILDRLGDELDGRFKDGIDPSRSISAGTDELTEPDGLLLLARLHGDPIGCGALKFHGDELAAIKRMWVDPSDRGLGLGRRLLDEPCAHHWFEKRIEPPPDAAPRCEG